MPTRDDCIGVDVAKGTLDLAGHQDPTPWQVPNDEAGIATVVARLRADAPAIIVLEATGGYEQAVVWALGSAGLRAPAALCGRPRSAHEDPEPRGQFARDIPHGRAPRDSASSGCTSRQKDLRAGLSQFEIPRRVARSRARPQRKARDSRVVCARLEAV